MSKGTGTTQQKILLLLLGGLALGLSRSPKTSFHIIKELSEEWKNIERRELRRAIASLYKSRLVATKPGKNGAWTLVLTDKGKTKALSYNIHEMRIPSPKSWDRKWRMVMFDIPEKIKRVRDSMRIHLKGLGCYELQKSVFVHPYDCLNEINYLIEFYNIRRHVRFLLVDNIDNELHLKKHFSLK